MVFRKRDVGGVLMCSLRFIGEKPQHYVDARPFVALLLRMKAPQKELRHTGA